MMFDSPPEAVVPTLIGITILLALATGALRLARVPHTWAPLTAVLRGGIQLFLLGIVLTGVIADPLWVGVALAVMFTVAAVTSTRRVVWSASRLAIVAASMALGVGITVTTVFGVGALEFSPRYALALGGIVIGGAMSVATLAGRRLAQATHERWDEVEGWLALGATPRQATVDLGRHAIYEALVPSLDQTKTTGLVTLPGAFVGAIFGGAAPLEAGRFQLIVLAAIMTAGAITAVVMVYAVAPRMYTKAP